MSDTNQFDAWLQGFPRVEAEERLQTLENEAQRIRNALALADAMSGSSNGDSSEAREDKPKNRPASIRRVLRERGGEPMAPGAIKDELLTRGWLKGSDLRLFYAAMSTMTKRGHILRLQDGGYILSKAGMEMD